MAYWITKFGTVTLSATQPNQDIGLGAAATGIVELPGGGVHDPWGSGRAPVLLPYRLPVNAIVMGTTGTDLRNNLYELRALHGQRAKLYRTPDGGPLNSEWVWARLEALRVRRRLENWLHLDVGMVFLVLSDPWSGADQTVDTVLDATPKNIVCANDGNARVDNAVITVTAKGSSITELEVVVDTPTARMQWAWTGTLAVDSVLEIDCGARTVRVDDADDYDGWALDASHNVPEWLRLEPGNTTVAVERTGGDATTPIQIAYADGWR